MSAPLQKIPSSQGAPSESGSRQLSATSSQLSAQSLSPSGPGHGSPAPTQEPLEQVSVAVQNSPSSQGPPSASSAVQSSLASLQESLQSGLEYADKALEVGGENNPDAHLLRSFVETWRGNHEDSIHYAKKTIELSPNMSDAWGQLGMSLNAAGRPEDAIPAIEKAMRLSPYYENYLLLQIGKAYRYSGQHEDAIRANLEILCRQPDSVFTHRDLALSYGALGRDEEARESIEALLKAQPDYSVQEYNESGDTGIDAEVRQRNIDILRRAGLPD